MTLQEWLTSWLEIMTPLRAPRTVAAYRFALAHLKVGLGETDMAAVSPVQMQINVNQVAAVYPRQGQILFTTLRASCNLAVKMGIVDRSPMRGVEMPTHCTRDIAYLTPPEVSRYLAALPRNDTFPPLLLMACCGLRRGEAMGLNWLCVDLIDNCIYVRQQRINSTICRLKSRKSRRSVPISPEIVQILSEYINIDTPGGLVYTGCAARLYDAHKEGLSRAGLTETGVTLHGLRHSYATAAVAGGANITTVQSLLGHAHYQLTADTYAHALDFESRRVGDSTCRQFLAV